MLEWGLPGGWIVILNRLHREGNMWVDMKEMRGNFRGNSIATRAITCGPRFHLGVWTRWEEVGRTRWGLTTWHYPQQRCSLPPHWRPHQLGGGRRETVRQPPGLWVSWCAGISAKTKSLSSRKMVSAPISRHLVPFTEAWEINLEASVGLLRTWRVKA